MAKLRQSILEALGTGRCTILIFSLLAGAASAGPIAAQSASMTLLLDVSQQLPVQAHWHMIGISGDQFQLHGYGDDAQSVAGALQKSSMLSQVQLDRANDEDPQSLYVLRAKLGIDPVDPVHVDQLTASAKADIPSIAQTLARLSLKPSAVQQTKACRLISTAPPADTGAIELRMRCSLELNEVLTVLSAIEREQHCSLLALQLSRAIPDPSSGPPTNIDLKLSLSALH
jgi:hypothetical protein